MSDIKTEKACLSKILAAKGKETQNQDELNTFPIRPAFGDKGETVKLVANYFGVNVQHPTTFYKYTLGVPQKSEEAKKTAKTAKIDRELAAQKREDKEFEAVLKSLKVSERLNAQDKYRREKEAAAKAPEGRSSAQGTVDKDDESKFKTIELEALIKQGFADLQDSNPNIAIATDFKVKIISNKPLALPMEGFLTANKGNWTFSINGPIELDIGKLIEYTRQPSDDMANVVSQQHPKFQDEIDALGVVLGFHARQHDHRAVLGSQRFFRVRPLDPKQPDRNFEHSLTKDGRKQLTKGAFQSVRIATNRLLLNVNVTNAIFYREESVDVTLGRFDWGSPRGFCEAEAHLKGVRVSYTVPGRAQPQARIEKIRGLESCDKIFEFEEPENFNQKEWEKVAAKSGKPKRLYKKKDWTVKTYIQGHQGGTFLLASHPRQFANVRGSIQRLLYCK